MRLPRALFASIVLTAPAAFGLTPLTRAALAQPVQGAVQPPAAPPIAAPPIAPAPAVQRAPAAQLAPASPMYTPWIHGAPASFWARSLPVVERRSTGMMATGITATSLGAVFMIIGTVAYEAGSACSGGDEDIPIAPGREEGNSIQFIPCRESAGRTTGMMLLVSGAITAAIGIPLWIVGQSEIRFPRDGSPPRDARAPRFVLRPGPGGMQIAF